MELDALPESVEAAEAEHAQIMQQVQQAQQTIELCTRRGIFLEGYIKAKSQPNRAARRASK